MIDHAQLRAAGPLAPAAAGRRTFERALRVVAGSLLLAAAYYAAGRASLALQYEGPVAAVWLSTGVGAAALYLAGLRFWPGVLIADVALADPTQPLGTALALTAGNLADVVAIAVLLKVLLGPHAALDRLRSVGGLLVAITAGAVITASVAAPALYAGGVVEGSALPGFWRSWLLADASGSLVIVPLALAWAVPPSPAWRGTAAWEGPLVIAAVVALSALGLSGDLPLMYLVFPALIWAALRFGPRGATVAVAVAAAVTVAMTASELGPFVTQAFTERALSTQLYIAVAALTTLCLAAIVSERERNALELAESRARLAVAAAEERRRVQGELHDSAQNRLVALGIRMRLAHEQNEHSAPGIAAVFPPLVEEIVAVIEELRRIVHGAAPPLLKSDGLVAALRAELDHSAIAVELAADDIGRSRPDVELATYLCCLEAIQNAAKHAGERSAVTVRLRRQGDALTFRIRDSGRGFDPRATRPGAGLTNLRERTAAVAGRLEISSAPGRGTTVSGVVPWPPRPPSRHEDAPAFAPVP